MTNEIKQLAKEGAKEAVKEIAALNPSKTELEILSLLQTGAAKKGDEDMLEVFCEIKRELLEEKGIL